MLACHDDDPFARLLSLVLLLVLLRGEEPRKIKLEDGEKFLLD